MVAALAASSREFLPPTPALCTKCVIGPSAVVVSSNTRTMSSSFAISPCNGDGPAAGFLDRVGNLGRRIGALYVVDRNVVAACAGKPRGCRADAAAAAGDEKNGSRHSRL